MIFMRLNQFLALCGVASRRKCDVLILEQKVTINGKIALPGARVQVSKDKVCVENKEVKLASKAYYLFFKPTNVLSTLADPDDRPTIKHYFKNITERVFPVGRLDFDSEGLIFLTNDGALAHKVQHPRYEIEKEYRVIADKRLTEQEEKQFSQGVLLEEGKTAPCQIEYLGQNCYQVVLHQGWYRQIRRMFDRFGVQITALRRVRIANLKIGNLYAGQYRALTLSEIKNLKEILKK